MPTPDTLPEGTDRSAQLAPDIATIGDGCDAMIGHGVRRVHVLAWRDLDDADAGGSEEHADQFMRRWADAGMDVTHRTSFAVGREHVVVRNGYRVIRRGGRMTVFPRTVASELTRRMGQRDALVEIWNGVPWFSPLWCHQPRMTFLHHVHGPMWAQILPGPTAAIGRQLEACVAPPFYRRSLTMTPSEATRNELLALGFRPERTVSVPNGVDPLFVPDESRRSPTPLLVCVGRQAPVKRFEAMIDAAIEAKRTVPALTMLIVGDGPSQHSLQQQVADAGAAGWITFFGHATAAELLDLYQRAWIVGSASLAEGWGLTLTEAAGCATPAVATDINGHRCSVVDGVTGLLAPLDGLGAALARVLLDEPFRVRLGAAAARRARTLTWDASALGVTRGLLSEVRRGRSRHRSA